jgi:hypothetical protein
LIAPSRETLHGGIILVNKTHYAAAALAAAVSSSSSLF